MNNYIIWKIDIYLKKKYIFQQIIQNTYTYFEKKAFVHNNWIMWKFDLSKVSFFTSNSDIMKVYGDSELFFETSK